METTLLSKAASSVKLLTLALATSGSLISMVGAANAEGIDPLKKVLVDDADVYLKFRYRLESIEEDSKQDDALASTLRTKLGYRSGELFNTTANIEIENVHYLGNDQFNNSINGQTQFSSIPDVDGTEINHAFLSFSGIPNTTINIGRQPVNLDNERFVGTEDWRQNDQTYDAAVIVNQSIPHTTAIYGFVNNVNRVNGDDHPLGDLDVNTHLANISYDGFGFGKFTAYGYIIDLNDSEVFTLSSKTFGGRFTGSTKIAEKTSALYTLEYAYQSELADNPNDYGANYYLIEGGIKTHGFKIKAGYEVLSSDNNVAFQTPLASSHKFNGYTDKFVLTPDAGLEDLYVKVGYEFASDNKWLDGLKLHGAYHDFQSDEGSVDYGSEIDLSVAKKIGKHYGVKFVYEDYDADTFSSDTEKYVMLLTAEF